MFAGLILGAFIGYGFLREIGAFIGGIGGVLLVGLTMSIGEKEAPEVCERIATGIEGYERLHLLSISTR